MTDRIILSGVELYAHGGVSDAEKTIGQRYRVDVELHADLERAARSDDLRDTVSYAEVHDLVVGMARNRPFNLLESLAGRICDALLERYAINGVTVRVEKLLPPIDGIVRGAAVELTRARVDRKAL